MSSGPHWLHKEGAADVLHVLYRIFDLGQMEQMASQWTLGTCLWATESWIDSHLFFSKTKQGSLGNSLPNSEG